jgi:hypothetical protein
MSYAELALGASNVLLGSAVGAGVNHSIFVMPRWFSSPPGSLPEVDESTRSLRAFWAPISAGSALALGSAWALNRNDPRRRPLLSVAGGLLVATWAATAAYFVPELFRLIRSGHQLGAEEVARRGRRWRNLNWARLGVLAGISVLAAAAAERRPARGIRRLLQR